MLREGGMTDLGVWIIMVSMAFFIAPSICSIASSLKKIAEREDR